MTANPSRVLTVFVIIFVLSIYLPNPIVTHRNVYAKTPLEENASIGPKTNSDFYIDQNFTIASGNNLTINDQNIIITSSELDTIDLTVHGHLIIENCTLFISNETINRVSSLNISVKGTGSLLKVEYSRLNYSGTLYLSKASALFFHTIVGENNGGNVNEPSRALRIDTYGSNVSVVDSRIGGQTVLNDPGNFRAGNIYGVNYNSQYPDSTPGNMTTHSVINTSINPIIDMLNLSISYKARANESYGVYFYLNTKSGILDNITLPYELGEGMKTIQLNLNVSYMSQRMGFFLNKSDFWLSKEFNTTDALGIFNLSITLYSNSWVRLLGQNYFSVISENSTYYFRNSSTDFNENSFKLIDGAQSYGKSYLELMNSTAAFVDTAIEGSEGPSSPVSVFNSTFIAAREVELEATDSGYSYPVDNFTVDPLNGTQAVLQYYQAEGVLSQILKAWDHNYQINVVPVPYFYDFDGNDYNFTDFSYSADKGNLRGMVSIDPFPNMSSNLSIAVQSINEPLQILKLSSADLHVSGISTFRVNVSGYLETNSSVGIMVNIENKTDGFNETFGSNITPNSNNSSLIRLNIAGLIPGSVYTCSIEREGMASIGFIAINSTPIKCLASLNGSVTISKAGIHYMVGGTSFLNATLSLNSSHSVAGSIVLMDGHSKVMTENVTLLPGENQFSFKVTNISQNSNISMQAHIPLLSQNSSNILSVKLIQNYKPEKYNIYFNETGLGVHPIWGIGIQGTVHMFYGKQGNVSLYSGNYSMFVISPSGYTSHAPGNIHVTNSFISIGLNFSKILYKIEFINTGSDNRTWKVFIGGSIFQTKGSTISVTLPSGIYYYEITEPEGYYTTNKSAVVNLTGNQSIKVATEKMEGTLARFTGVLENEKYVAVSGIILIASIAFAMSRRKHRWKIHQGKR